MFKPASGRKQEKGVWKYFNFDDVLHAPVQPNSAGEEKCDQPPLKRFRLLAQDMSARSSSVAVTAANTVDNELIAYIAESKTYEQNSWVTILDCK
jgi:hypothetical protein